MITDSTSTALAAKVGPLIDTLAAKLSVPARGVWDIMLAQARVEFIKSSIAVAIELVVLGVAIGVMIGGVRRLKDNNEEAGIPMVVGASIVGMVCTLAFAISIDGWITALGHTINPGYFAITKLLAAVR